MRAVEAFGGPREARQAIREGRWTGPTAGLCPGYAQANLVVLPRQFACDFLLFCQRNPNPCPLLEVTDAGSWEPRRLAPGADLRTDVPRYRIYRDGRLEGEPTDVLDLWRDDLVAFLFGCSFTFERALLEAGVPVRHLEEGKNVPMYVTNRACDPAGIFRGPLVVTMRPIPVELVPRAVQVTARFPGAHGAPVHVGDPAALGIRRLERPDFGDAVTVRDGEMPVFWACGVTAQAVALESKASLMLTHAPGHMFITDRKDADLSYD
ncbi:putative hydro-lyase [Carboxydichorda subterranea]|uniref:putative hydro-lyase n=1 Tax=Carboxydichorda subterranea TaxID=3109565 RepID=UPI0038578FDE